MKKIIFSSTIVVIMLSIVSCFGGNREITYIDDIFFDEETLIEYHFDNLPAPEFEDSRMDDQKPNVLYLNMSELEFQGYCEEVAEYLLSREDIYYPGIQHDIKLFVGPLFIPMSYDVYIPLCDNLSALGSSNKFGFALDNELTTGWVVNGMRDAYEISLYRIDGQLEDDEGYKYNTYIEINEARGVYEPCAKEHKYGEELSYPVPNTKIVIDISYCEYCGSRYQSEYYGGVDNHHYSINISGDKSYLESECLRKYTVNPNGYAGLIEEVILVKKENVEYKVCVNGFEIPLISEDGKYLIYGFIMPMSDIEIEISVTESE